ncbi:Restriction endonuclease [Perilla frutescens var. hirtella]|nr:Restriction endonuclease [Perilla frutescens var. hirtella]
MFTLSEREKEAEMASMTHEANDNPAPGAAAPVSVAVATPVVPEVAGSRTMTNARIAIFGRINGAILPPPHQRKLGIVFIRNFFTCASPFVPSSSSHAVKPPTAFVLNAVLAASDAPQRSDEWFALRKDKLTTSTFSTALGMWKGNSRSQLWHEKVFPSNTQIAEGSKKGALEWGLLNEAAAIERYKSITARDVSSLGFAIHSEERLDWIGASPDGLLGCCGVLEVKCPFNKGKPEAMLPWKTMPFYYMPQIQGQMEVTGRDWADLYCWTPNGSTIFRVYRERGYWELLHGILREFWWENVVPAKEALLLGRKEEANSLKPTSTHKLTGLVIAKSLKLAGEAKLLCREMAGRVEFFR